jgi:ferritin-like metal-binding protein YciE
MSTAEMEMEVIDWDEAMQQCGDDEEFLRELLDDLRSETDTQIEKIEETLKVKSQCLSINSSLSLSPDRFYALGRKDTLINEFRTDARN